MSKKVLLALAVACLAMAALTTPVHAQYGSLPIGTVQNVLSANCPGSGWYSYTSGNNTTYMNCFSATVTNCASVSNLSFTYGFLDPANLVPGVTQERGVIVLLSGQGGTSPAPDPVGVNNGDISFLDYYFRQGYEVVELAWTFDWEYLIIPPPPSSYGNIQAAACRPATFLNYIFNQLYLPIYNSHSTAGMCAHGFSAGSAAVAYSMAYYKPPANGQWWLDNVELLSGPVFSDIKQGCHVPAVPKVTVCGTQNGQNQWGCQLGGDQPWQFPPEYLSPSDSWVQGWTDDMTCAGSQNTTSSSDSSWLQQSIVDDGTNNPVFSYPHTAMAGWLCRNVVNKNHVNCATNFDWQDCENESSPQGELFYAAITANGAQPSNYAVYSVDGCDGAEGVGGTDTVVPGYHSGSYGGLASIEYDMAGNLTNNIQAACVHPH